MDEVEIKYEFNKDEQCRTCLSVGRRLSPLGSYTEIYSKIITDYPYAEHKQEIKICWECEALLRNVIRFKSKAETAQELLQSGQNVINTSLSTLTTVSNNTIQAIYVETPTDNDYPDDITEDIEIEIKTVKPKINNKWAIKRAKQNKKPKFRIVEANFETDAVAWDDVYSNKEIHKCEICGVGFEKDVDLINHKKRHKMNKNTYICDICKKHFYGKRHLSVHIRTHNKYKCIICQYVSNKIEMKKHMDEHRNIYECIKCLMKLRTRRDFYMHFKEWHEKFTCDYCGISFKMRYCIKDHIRKQHSPFECKPCKKTFARYNGLWLHNKIAHNPPTGAAYCVECDKRYVNIYRYRWHLANSTRHKPRKRVSIPCPSCDKTFSKNIYMKDHYNLVHLKHFKYRCEDCDKNFIRNADLVKHKKRVHEGILPPKNKICYICGRGFSANKILTNHLRTHTGERPFACAHCPARFAQSTAAKGHARTHHSQLLDVA